MPATRYPPAEYRPVRNTSGSMVQPTRGLIPHVQVGNGSLFAWFDDPDSQASSHLWLSKAGEFEQYVPFDRKAWAQVGGNPFWISVECEGRDTEDYTPIQVQRLAELYAWGMREFRWPAAITDSPDGYGIGTHRMGGAAWGNHSCPGNIRAGRRGDILAAALGRPAVPPPNEQEDFVDAEARKQFAKEISEKVRADLNTDIRHAKSGGRNLADMRFGPAGEALGIGVIGVGLLRDDLETVKGALAALAAGDARTAAAIAAEQPLTVDRMLQAIGQATDQAALIAFLEAGATRLGQLYYGHTSSVAPSPPLEDR